MRAAAFLCAAAAFAQQPASDDVFARARARLAAAAASVPRYTCTETVDRSYFRETRQVARSCDAIVANRRSGRARPELVATDRLRFDVEVADGGYEIYAWPGAARIENQMVEQMSGGGPLGTGPFGPFLVDIFTNPAVEFQSLGLKTGLFEYRYRVPLAASHYLVQAGVKFHTTAYDGAFLLDPVTAELKHLTVRTLELPPDTASCEATTTMDFSPLRIGAADYLVPRLTILQVVARDSASTENSTVYSDCHEFRAESIVRFDQPLSSAANASELPARDRPPTLPPGMPVEIALDSEIDTDRAAACDPVSGTIAKPLIDPARRRVLVPAGAAVRGRITHLEHKLAGEKYFLVGISFQTLDFGGSSLPLAIILDASRQVLDPRSSHGRGVITTESRSGFHGGGTFVFPSSAPRYVVPRGYTSHWITVPGAQ